MSKKSLEERVAYLEALLGASALTQLGEEEKEIPPQPDPEGFVVINVDTWGGKEKSVRLVPRLLELDQYEELVRITRSWRDREEDRNREIRPPTWILREIDRSCIPVRVWVLMDERFQLYELG